jgi:hypothetical protein
MKLVASVAHYANHYLGSRGYSTDTGYRSKLRPMDRFTRNYHSKKALSILACE